MTTSEACAEAIKFNYREIRKAVLMVVEPNTTNEEVSEIDVRLHTLLDVQEILTGRDRQDILLAVCRRINNDRAKEKV